MTAEQLRRFVVLAEELSFTRAARRLHIAQQVLSTQTKQLEREVGARLFDRSTHHVALTAAGAELLTAATAALATLDAGIARARETVAASRRRVRVGFIAQGANELQAPMLRDFRRRHQEATVEIRSFPFTDPLGGLATGESDVAFLPHPPSHPAVRLEPLLEEQRICVFPADHPLAGRDAIDAAELATLPVIVVRGYDTDPLVGAWTEAHTLSDRLGPREIGAVVETPEEWLQAAEDGLGFTTVPASVTRFYPRPSLRGVLVTGVEPLVMSIGWRAELDDDPLVASILELAREAARGWAAAGPGGGIEAPAG